MGLRKYNKDRFKFAHKQFRDRTFFDDLLKIFLFGFIEIGAAAMLTLHASTENVDYTFVNICIASLCVIELIVVLPLTYSLILGQKPEVYRRRSF